MEEKDTIFAKNMKTLIINDIVFREYPFDGRYFISECGKIWSCITNRILNGNLTSLGYLSSSIFNPRTNKNGMVVHRLVAYTWMGNPPNDKPEINHKDGNKLNNHVNNLEWCTRSENVKHGFDSGLFNSKREAISENNRKLWAEGKKQKMIEAAAFKKKNKHLFEQSVPQKVIQISTGKVFNSKYEACKLLNIPISTMNSILKGSYKKIDYKFYTP
jgi:hypothetical protein